MHNYIIDIYCEKLLIIFESVYMLYIIFFRYISKFHSKPGFSVNICTIQLATLKIRMSLAISIKNRVTYEDVHDAEEEVKFVEHNVVEGDVPLWQQRCAYLLDNIMHECIKSALCVYTCMYLHLTKQSPMSREIRRREEGSSKR